MADPGITILGIPIPSSSALFLTLVAIHVLAGIVCVLAGILAMLLRKGRGGHATAGSVYFSSLALVFITMTALAAMRWPHDNQLFTLGLLSIVSATIGRTAQRRAWPPRLRIHIASMGLSYILMLTAFYVDNGPHLPLWRSLPPLAFWLGPSLVGLPIILWALLRHPLARSAPNPTPRSA